MQIDKDAPVPGVEVTVELVEHGCLSGSPLPVEHDWRVAVPSDQVPLDKGEDVFAAVEHLSAGDGATRDVGVHVPEGVHGKPGQFTKASTVFSKSAMAATDCGSLAQVMMSWR